MTKRKPLREPEHASGGVRSRAVAPPGEALARPVRARAQPAGKAPDEGVQRRLRNLDMVMRIPVTVKIVLGSATMPVSSLVKLGRGAVIPLDRRVGEPVDVVVNGRVVARGEVVVVDEASSRFGIKLTEVVGPVGDRQGNLNAATAMSAPRRSQGCQAATADDRCREGRGAAAGAGQGARRKAVEAIRRRTSSSCSPVRPGTCGRSSWANSKVWSRSSPRNSQAA